MAEGFCQTFHLHRISNFISLSLIDNVKMRPEYFVHGIFPMYPLPATGAMPTWLLPIIHDHTQTKNPFFMKQFLILIIVMIALGASAIAQSPDKFSYQAVIRDSNGDLVVNQLTGIRISILQGTITGTAVFMETHQPVTNANGLVTLEIGTGAVVSGNLSLINWANGPYFLKTETDPAGGTNYSISGTSQLLSVPYALYAKTAEYVVETDPVFLGSAAGGISSSDITSWHNKLSAETDPVFSSSAAGSINTSNITNWNNKLSVETDPVFTASAAGSITGTNITSWNNKLSVETDPVFTASAAGSITGTNITNWNNKVSVETDPVFTASAANSITSSHITSWNNKLSSETDPVFTASAAGSITGTNITNWNNKVSVETDPVFTASAANSITPSHITSWNDKLSSETDPVFMASPAGSITGSNITSWNSKLSSESDPVFMGSTASGITSGDTTSWNNKLSTESDPLFTASPAGTISTGHISSWNSKLSTETDPVFTAWDRTAGISITESQISNLKSYILTESDPLFINSVAGGITASDTARWNGASGGGSQPGEMYYWDGVQWQAVLPGVTGQTLTFCNGVPTWGPCVPRVITASVSSVTYNAATVDVDVTHDGGSPVTVRGLCLGTAPNPTIAGVVIPGGSGTGTFTTNISGLSPTTTYYVRGYATNSNGLAYGNELSFTTPPYVPVYPLQDIDGNNYDTVHIGSQIWMKQNLRTTRYKDGIVIPGAPLTNATWMATTTGALCWYNNDSAANAAVYGALYNYYALETGKLCPAGWHVPSQAEFDVLLNLFGGTINAGGPLKETGTTHWLSPNSGATNVSGWTALPGGFRSGYDGVFYGKTENGYWWSSTATSSTQVWIIDLAYYHSSVGTYSTIKNNGMSVRCLKD